MRFVGVLGVVVLLVGCGDTSSESTVDQAAASAAPAPALAFVHRPVVVRAGAGTLTTAVRTTVALPGDGLGLDAALQTSGANPNAGTQLERIPGYRRCYAYEAPVDAESPPKPGQPVTVELRTEDGVVLRARVPVSTASSTPDAVRGTAARTLGCARGTTERRCTGAVTDGGPEIQVQRAFGGASCATARAVLRQVATRADPNRCFEDLCVERHRVDRGFRCTVAKVGEANWTVTCRRGRQTVRGAIAE